MLVTLIKFCVNGIFCLAVRELQQTKKLLSSYVYQAKEVSVGLDYFHTLRINFYCNYDLDKVAIKSSIHLFKTERVITNHMEWKILQTG